MPKHIAMKIYQHFFVTGSLAESINIQFFRQTWEHQTRDKWSDLADKVVDHPDKSLVSRVLGPVGIANAILHFWW